MGDNLTMQVYQTWATSLVGFSWYDASSVLAMAVVELYCQVRGRRPKIWGGRRSNQGLNSPKEIVIKS